MRKELFLIELRLMKIYLNL